MRRGRVLIEYDYTFNIFLAVKKTESSSPLSTQAEHPQGFLIPLDFSCNSLIHKLLGKFIAPILLHLRASNVFAVKMRGRRRRGGGGTVKNVGSHLNTTMHFLLSPHHNLEKKCCKLLNCAWGQMLLLALLCFWKE